MKNEFNNYATNHLGISSSVLNDYQNSATPYILEERQLRVTQMDIFSRLMMDRIIWIPGAITDVTGVIIQAQLMFLYILILLEALLKQV